MRSIFAFNKSASLTERLRETGQGALAGAKVSLMGLGVILLALTAYLDQPKRIFLNTTVSLPAGVYYYLPGDVFGIEKGDLVRFNYVAPKWVRDRHWPHKKEYDTYLKRVVGTPGDRVIVRDREITVCPKGGMPCEAIARRLETDRYGDGWPELQIEEVIPEDKFFLVGTHPASFDSRYIGYVDRNQILGRAKAIWVEQQKPVIFQVDWDQVVRDEVPKHRAERDSKVVGDE